MKRIAATLALAACAPLLMAAQCFYTKMDAQAATSTGGNYARGRVIMRHYGCGSCHQIPGVPGAYGTVGPSLEGIQGRSYLAGNLSNDADTLKMWIQHPQKLIPGNAMPEMGVSDRDAADMAAYLYTLK